LEQFFCFTIQNGMAMQAVSIRNSQSKDYKTMTINTDELTSADPAGIIPFDPFFWFGFSFEYPAGRSVFLLKQTNRRNGRRQFLPSGANMARSQIFLSA